jgi:ferredoxin-NADP reductase
VTASDAVSRSRVWDPATHATPGTAPDLAAMASDHLAANLARTEQGSLARVLKGVTRIPGFGRLMRLVLDGSYRSGLRKEGYEDVAVGSRRGGRPEVSPAGPDTTHPLRAVRIAEIRRETSDAVTLVLADAESAESAGRPGTFDFLPGQFFTLVADVDGRPVRRAYSASSAPGAPRLEVTVKRVDGGRFSTHVHENLRVGDRLSVRGPSGSFHADPSAAGELVLIAAGSGVTPMMSVIRTLLAGPGGRITLLCTNRGAEDVIFADELVRLEREHPERLAVTHVLTREHGRLDPAGLHDWLTNLRPARDARYYLCGPEALMDMVRGVLAERGVPDERVHLERYSSGPDPVTAGGAPQELVVVDGEHEAGSVVVEPGQTLLDAGLAAGLPMPYSCTVGSCGDCMVKLRDGQVAMSGPNCLTSQEEADGYVLTCVGCPLSKVTVDIAEP